jgi:hypothetical protein
MSGVDWEKVRESLTGCSAHVCVIKKPVGMGTNGPCHCLRDRLTVERYVGLLKHDLEQANAKLTTSQVSEPVGKYNTRTGQTTIYNHRKVQNDFGLVDLELYTTPQEAISPAIADLLEAAKAIRQVCSEQWRDKDNLIHKDTHKLVEYFEALASKPTGLD